MEQKIRDYVNYQLRFDKRDDIDDLKEEIIANLIDRYHESFKKMNNEEKAYIDAIKQMGDFTNGKEIGINEEFYVKPAFYDVALIIAAILSIFGLIIILFSGVAGAITTAISICCYSGGAYYLYSHSQYIRKHNMDIKTHNLLLKKIFKHMKTCFVFWAISLSFLLASLVTNILTSLILLGGSMNNIEVFQMIFIVSVAILILSLIIFLLIFYTLYQKLIHKYYFLTGETSLKGGIAESYEFLHNENNQNPSKFSKIIKSRYTLPILGLLLFLPTLLIFDKVYLYHYPQPESIPLIGILVLLILYKEWYLAIFPLLYISISFGVIIFRLIKKDRISNKLLILLNYGLILVIAITYILISNYSVGISTFYAYNFPYILIYLIFYSVFLIIRKLK